MLRYRKLIAQTSSAFRRAYSAAPATATDGSALAVSLTASRTVLRIAGQDTVEFLQVLPPCHQHQTESESFIITLRLASAERELLAPGRQLYELALACRGS